MTRFVVSGAPVPKGRPRLVAPGVVLTPKRTKGYEKRVKLQALAARGGGRERMLPGPVRVELVIYRDHTEVVVRPDHDPDARIARGDGDNYAKAILDAVQGVLYENDRQVTDLHVMLRGKT